MKYTGINKFDWEWVANGLAGQIKKQMDYDLRRKIHSAIRSSEPGSYWVRVGIGSATVRTHKANVVRHDINRELEEILKAAGFKGIE